MFARIVSIHLKPGAGTEFSHTIEKKILPLLRKQKGFRDEVTFITSGGEDVVAISLWDQRQHAEAYSTTVYPEVIQELSKIIDGTPRIQTYEVANSTVHNIAARAA